MRLTNDLGEAASRVKAAQQKLANSDQNPSMALKAAVDVRTEKAKYAKLHDLAESALTTQKAKSAKKIQEAEEKEKLEEKLKEIKKMAKAKVKAERVKFKAL